MRDGAAGGIILVLDENLSSRRIAEGLFESGVAVKLQTELMRRGLPDEKVLAVLANHPDYYLLSKDSDFHRKPAIRSALIRHKIGAFVITAHKGKTADDLVALIKRAWPGVQRCAKNHSRPFVAKILADGRVEVTA